MAGPDRSTAPSEPTQGRDAHESDTPPPSRVFAGRYVIVRELGRGGMGRVFVARDQRLSREVALKVLTLGEHDGRQLRRFEDEARAAGSIKHPNIVVVHDAGEQDGQPYIITELLEGETLRQMLARGPLPPSAAGRLALQIAHGLAAAHELGMVHRDLKPENLFVTHDGVLKILDFGIALLPRDSTAAEPFHTATGAVLGTVSYMSPEQVRGAQVDARSDIFALGSVLHETLSGAPPFERATALDTAHAILAELPARLPAKMAPGLRSIVERCLEKDPAGRFQSAGELADALAAMQAGKLPLLAELNRRRVFRALIGYGIAAFAVLQIIEPVMHGLHWPDAVLSYAVIALALGFPLVVMLAWVFDVKSGGVERTRPMMTARRRRIPIGLVLAIIGILAAAPGVVYYFVIREHGHKPGIPVAAPSIAVLPFLNMSSDKETDYFSDGITEELINSLANIDMLRVVSRTAVFALKGKSLSVDQIGAHLNANMLLEGSVRREGNALRVTAQLINVADGYHLWSKTYHRELKSIFAIEDEIAHSIAQTLQRTLVRPDRSKPTSSLEAHDDYLKGRYFLNKRTLEAVRKAADYFERAIRLDLEYPLAYAGLADAIALRMDYDVVPTSQLAPGAKAAARRAVELDPRLAEAHCSLGNIAWHEWEWATALNEFRTAIDLKPDYATARQWYAETLMSLGRADEAKTEITRALQIDPTSPIINTVAGRIRFFARDYDGALEHYRKALELDPSYEIAHVHVAWAYMWKAMYAEAAAELDKTLAGSIDSQLESRAMLEARAGRTANALRMLRHLEEKSRREYVPPSTPAISWIALGEKDRAFPLLQRACAEHDSVLLNIKVAPYFDPIRSDPRFKKLLACMHLD